ncbi:MAG: RrF2 family transcriptional regulator [Fimbriiglobus sp.]
MFFSAKAEYASLAMLELAAQFGDARPVRLTDIAEKHDIPQRFLVQILLQLKTAGLVVSVRGAAGGYQLARSPADITLGDVLGVMDRADAPDLKPSKPGNLSPQAAALHGVWEELQAARAKILRRTTLATLLEAGHGLQYVI